MTRQVSATKKAQIATLTFFGLSLWGNAISAGDWIDGTGWQIARGIVSALFTVSLATWAYLLIKNRNRTPVDSDDQLDL